MGRDTRRVVSERLKETGANLKETDDGQAGRGRGLKPRGQGRVTETSLGGHPFLSFPRLPLRVGAVAGARPRCVCKEAERERKEKKEKKEKRQV